MKQKSGFRVLYAVLLRPLQGTCISATQIHHRRISQQPRWTWTQESGNNSWASYVFANRSSLETVWSILNGKLLVRWLDRSSSFRRWCASDIHLEDAWSTWTSGWVHEETKPDHCKKNHVNNQGLKTLSSKIKRYQEYPAGTRIKSERIPQVYRLEKGFITNMEHGIGYE